MKLSIRELKRQSRIILQIVGLLLHIPGVMALLSLPICWIFGENYAVWPFILTSLMSFSLGQFLYRRNRQVEQANLKQSMLIVAIAWAVIPLVGMIPFLAIGHHLATFPDIPQTIRDFQDPWNALFEAVSGFTSTGLTMATDPSQLPHTLQWWRSLTEWVGGVGVIALMLVVLEPTTDPEQLYQAAGWEQKIAPTLKETVRRMWIIYGIYTLLSILLFWGVGMPIWEAINHGLTGIATGGFSITAQSFTDYSPIIQLAAIPIMILGAISFSIHAQLLRQRRLILLWKNAQHRLLGSFLIVGSILLLLIHFSQTGNLQWIDSGFQWVSALTTCGFNSVDVGTLSSSAKLFIALGMIFGAASGSTCGGIKLSRIYILYKAISWHLQDVFLASEQSMQYKLNGEEISDSEAYQEIKNAAVLATLWIGLIGLSLLILLQVISPEYSSADAFLEAASALGTAGLSVGISAPDLHWLGKWVLILLMWMGRLEIIPVLVLVASLLRLSHRPKHHRTPAKTPDKIRERV